MSSKRSEAEGTEDATALSDKARRSVEKSVTEEVKDEAHGRRAPGMPRNKEFTTPRVDQGEDPV